MTKILKKSLACLLAFALCFTAVASCLAVSAAAPAMASDVSFHTQSRPGDHRDDNANELCVGEEVRAQITLENIQAGSSIGIEVDLPTGLNPSEITYGTFDKGAKFDIVSKNYDEETGKFTMILDVTTTGDYVYFVYFIVGENVPQDRVFSLEYKIEAAFASNDAVYKKTSAQPWPMRVFAEHVVETLEAVAPTCTETGLTEGSHCARCLETFEAQEEVEATGHAWDAGVPNPDATCDSEGTLVYTCANDPSHTYTEAISAKGHTPAAELVDNEDGTHSEVCDVCGAVLSTADHDFTDGDCACGATKPAEGVFEDPNLVYRDISLAYGAKSLEIKFRLNSDVLNLYDNVKVVILPQKYDASTGNLVENVQPIVIEETDLERPTTKLAAYTYTDAFLYELGLTIEYKLMAYNANGELEAVSETWYTSGDKILKEFHTKAVNASNAKFATLITDTLIVADEAIKSMAIDKAGSHIATAGSILKDYDDSDKTKSYASTNTVDTFESSYEGLSKDKSAKHRVIQAVSIGKLPYLTVRIKDDGNSVFDINKLAYNIRYTKLSGNGSSTEFNETYTTADEGYIKYQSNYIWFSFEEIGAQNSDKDITITVTYDGQPLCTSVYSVETYLTSQLSNTKTGALCDALIKLGVSFKAYVTK